MIVGRVLLGGRPFDRLAVAAALAQRERRDVEQGRLHRRGDGARIGHVLAEVAAVIDPGEHEVDGAALDHDLEREQHAVGRRAVDREAAPRQPADAQRPVHGQRVRGAALIGLGRHHPDVAAELARDPLQDLEARAR